MRTITSKRVELISENIFGEENQGDFSYLYYKDICVFSIRPGESPKVLLTDSEVLLHLGIDLASYNSTYHKKSTVIIDTLWYQHLGNKNLFFKSGKIRRGFITELKERLFSDYLYFPATKQMARKLTANWASIPVEIKADLYEYFSPEGEFIGTYKQLYIINPGGEVKIQKVNPELYRQANTNLPSLRFGALYVKKTSVADIEVKFKSVSTRLTIEEFQYLQKYFSQCSSCNSWELKDNFIFGICSACAGDFPKDLAGYTTRAHELFDPIIGKSKYSSTLLGVELEYEFSGNKLETLFLLHKHLKNHAVLKRDGSLSNGVEICTRPASIDIHLGTLKNAFEDEELMKRIKVETTCGMHVHIDRRKMSALTLGKLIQFMQNKDNKTLLQLIAERSDNRFSKLATGLTVTSFHRGLASGDRYQGINTQNQNTAEIRIFKTPNSFKQFLKNMEFVSAISDFVQPANSGVKDMTTDSFLHFVKSNKFIYKELFTFLKEKENV